MVLKEQFSNKKDSRLTVNSTMNSHESSFNQITNISDTTNTNIDFNSKGKREFNLKLNLDKLKSSTHDQSTSENEEDNGAIVEFDIIQSNSNNHDNTLMKKHSSRSKIPK